MLRAVTGCAFMVLLSLGACRFDSGGVPEDGGVIVDADPNAPDADPNAPDADPNAPDARLIDAGCEWPFTPRYFDPCGPGAPTLGADLTLSNVGTWEYDTDTGVLSDPLGGMSMPPSSVQAGVRVIGTRRFLVGALAILRATGSVPLMIVSGSSISINGKLDVSSFVVGDGVDSGAGADPSVCPDSPPDPGTTCAQHAGSGGGGGGFGSAGGDGGEGGDTRDCGGGQAGVPGGAGGVTLAGGPTALRGGCAGRDGAQNETGTSDRGLGSAGGGAIHLVAFGALTVSGTVHAGGAGGRPGLNNRSGGGGGGTGGMIGLEATSIVLNAAAVVAANGGGGGGGCDSSAALPGIDGQPSSVGALGGAGQGNGAAGGAGGVVGSLAGQNGVTADRGGGGGGGSVGVIDLLSPNAMQIAGTAVLSPAP